MTAINTNNNTSFKMDPLLQSVSPEPISMDDIITPGIPDSPTSKSYTTKLIPILTSIQKYGTIPFSIFSVIHLSGVVIAPGLAQVDIGEQLISMGRELYQVSAFESIMLWSSLAHIISGISLRFIRQYQNYKKYGKRKVKKRRNSRTWKTVDMDKHEQVVDDKDEGLGGITSLLGLGSRKSLSSRFLGLSPISFSGYILLPMLLYHVAKERIGALIVDGDSSFIDLSYISHNISIHPFKTSTGLVLLTLVGAYHVISGWNRYLKLFSLTARRRTYGVLSLLTILAASSMVNISKLGPAFGMTAKKFDAFVNATPF